MSKAQEFLNDVIFSLEKTGTIDGYYFSARLAGMSIYDVPGEVPLAATDCKGKIFVDLDEILGAQTTLFTKALFFAHEIRHNDGVHMDRLLDYYMENTKFSTPDGGWPLDLEERTKVLNNDPEVNKFVRFSNIVLDLVINEGLSHTFGHSSKEFMDGFKWKEDQVFNPITLERIKTSMPDLFEVVTELGYNQANIHQMDPLIAIDKLLERADQGKNKKKASGSEGKKTDDDGDLGAEGFEVDVEIDAARLVKKGTSINDGMFQDSDDPQQTDAKFSAVKQATIRAKESGLRGMGPAGCVPSYLAEEFESFKKPTISFKNLLRATMKKRARVQAQYHKPRQAYRRQGVFMPSVGGQKSGTIAFLIDTSGSVPTEVLKEMMGEVDNALKNMSYDKCVVIQFSNEIESINEYRSNRRRDGLDKKVYGRGGTEINKALMELNKYKDLSATVVLTDGGLYDIAKVNKEEAKVFHSSPAYWFVPEKADDSRVISSYLDAGGHGELVKYSETGKVQKQVVQRKGRGH